MKFPWHVITAFNLLSCGFYAGLAIGLGAGGAQVTWTSNASVLAMATGAAGLLGLAQLRVRKTGDVEVGT